MNQAGMDIAEECGTRRAFAHYLRTGRRLRMTTGAAATPIETKFNPNHDPRNGQFTFGTGGSGSLGSWMRSGRTRVLPAAVRAPIRADMPATEDAAQQINRLDDGVYRPDSDQNLLRLAQYRVEPPRGIGDNSGAFQDLTTLEQVFPGLRDAPGGSILPLVDSVFNASGPKNDMTTAMSLEYSKKLIGEIKQIDPSYHLDSLGSPQTLQGQMNQIDELRFAKAAASYRIRGETGPLQVETLRFVQRQTDVAYEQGKDLYEAGKLNVIFRRRSARSGISWDR